MYSNILVSVDLGDAENEAPPEAFGLEPNYPNPFHATTTVRYRVARGGHVRLEVYNETGQRVETLVDGFATSGTHTVEWDAGDLGAGVYFCRMEAGEEASVRAFVVLN